MSAYGLIGSRIERSLSPLIHSLFGCEEYGLMTASSADLPAVLNDPSLRGCNVTMPFKTDVLPLCDELSDAARAIGCVNTVVRRSDGSLYGDNTDAAGFAFALDDAKIDVAGKKTLVFGAGGASKALTYVLMSRGADVTVVSRRGGVTYHDLDRFRDAKILVNATPLGSTAYEDETPVSLDAFERCEAVFDAVYDPLRTRFVCEASERGIKACGGLTMLTAQAAYAETLFGKRLFTEADIIRVRDEVLKRTRSVVLIGMPGCGKTTLAERLGQMTGRIVYDTDREVYAETGRTPAQIILSDGEDAFRSAEKNVIRRLSRVRGAVIATGGGSVLDAENRSLLRRNAVVIYLDRDPETLETSGRPISLRYGSVRDMARDRMPYYAACRDVTVKVTDVDTTANEIRKAVSL